MKLTTSCRAAAHERWLFSAMKVTMLERLIGWIDTAVAAIGKGASFLTLLMTALIVLEMVSRSFFGTSWGWVYDLSGWLLAAYIFLGGAWTLQRGQFVRVDILFTRFSPRTRALVDLVAGTALFVLFAGALLWLGTRFAWQSFLMNEVSATGAWDAPVYVAKALLPIGVVLLCLAWLSHILKLWRNGLRSPE
jgi:TRAP-type mannitol/chloroaromatic compound transport system permease small subunit